MTIVQRARPRLARRNAPALIEPLGSDEFEGYASLFDVADGAGDVVQPGAFAQSLKRRPPAKVRMLYQHLAGAPLGVWESIVEDARGLYVRGRLKPEVQQAQDVASLIAQGALNGLSIGFRAIRARRVTGRRLLTEIDLWEISIVTFPLLEGSEVTAIGRKAETARAMKRAANLFREFSRQESPPRRGGRKIA
jgi:HK97 family phage prohead protease